MKATHKYKFWVLIVLCFTLLFSNNLPVLAANDAEADDSIAITVIIPSAPVRPTPTPEPRRLFPVNVAEGYNFDGVRELVRIYELLPHESPEWIDTASFERNGYYYQIAEITRRMDVAHTVKEHTEIIEVQTETNNLAAVIAGLQPTIDFMDYDGYVGILHLDIHSIQMTQDGSRSTSRTVSQTREYPHLASPDIALIPQSISASGNAYSLANVEWKTNTSSTIDYSSVAQTYTAVASYTRTATSTVATGFTTRAEYNGTLTRVATGDTRFVATFIGTPIVSPAVNTPTLVVSGNTNENTAPEQGQNDVLRDLEDEATTEMPINTEAPTATEVPVTETPAPAETNQQEPTADETVQELVGNEDNNKFRIGDYTLPILFAVFVLAVVMALALIALKYKKKADTLQDKLRKDILRSRMERIVRKDRRELAGKRRLPHVDEDSDLEGFDDIDDEYDFEDYEDFEIEGDEDENEYDLPDDDLAEDLRNKKFKTKGDYG